MYDILDDYKDIFLQIDLKGMNTDKETFTTKFRTVCFVVLSDKGHGVCYVLSILGFALHIHTQCNELAWYDVETLVVLLIETLISVNFDPSVFVKRCSCVII